MESTALGQAMKAVLDEVEQGAGWSPTRLVFGPSVRLDEETYALLKQQALGKRHAYYFHSAIQAAKDHVQPERLRTAANAVKHSRVEATLQLIRTRLDQEDLSWLQVTAKLLALKEASFLEGILFLYTRAMKRLALDRTASEEVAPGTMASSCGPRTISRPKGRRAQTRA